MLLDSLQIQQLLAVALHIAGHLFSDIGITETVFRLSLDLYPLLHIKIPKEQRRVLIDLGKPLADLVEHLFSVVGTTSRKFEQTHHKQVVVDLMFTYLG